MGRRRDPVWRRRLALCPHRSRGRDCSRSRARAAALGNYLIQGIKELAPRHRSIGEIRGLGLMIGIEVGNIAPEIVKHLLKKGFIANAANNTVLRLLPPLIISRKDIDEFLIALDGILGEIESA